MPIRSDAPDLAVDELKRRARRRLVGAIVLALAAAVILPMLLESDPKPLGDEVSIRIPPVDNGKFINPLAPDKGRENVAPGSADSKAEPKPGAVMTPKKSITEAERRVLGQPAAQLPSTPPAANTAATAPSVTTPEPSPAAASIPTPAVSAPTPPSVGANLAKADVPSATPSQPAAASGAFAVQVGAYADTKVAADLAATLKSAGYATYTEAVPTTQGSVQRVRIGPYATRGAADTAAAKLKAAGYDRALVTNTK
jgi:DedD protein